MKIKNNIALILMLLITLSPGSCGHGPASKHGVVLSTFGKVVVSPQAGKAVQLKAQDTVKAGDTVVTRAHSLVTIQVGEDLYFNIQANSRVTISKLNLATESELVLPAGKILVKVRKIRKGTDLKIKTPTVVASVRGTSYSVTAVPEISTVAVKEGKVLVEPTGGVKEKDKESLKERIVSGGNTVIVVPERTMLHQRPIGAIESLELEKVENAQFASNTDLKDGKDILKTGKRNRAQDGAIDKKIRELINKKKPEVLKDIKRIYGKIDVIQLYTGRVYKGLIITRGNVYQILVPEGVINIPGDKIKTTNVEK